MWTQLRSAPGTKPVSQSNIQTLPSLVNQLNTRSNFYQNGIKSFVLFAFIYEQLQVFGKRFDVTNDFGLCWLQWRKVK